MPYFFTRALSAKTDKSLADLTSVRHLPSLPIVPLFFMRSLLAQPPICFMLIVFTSFLLFFSLLLWYADKHTKSTEQDRVTDKQNTSRNGTASGFDYFDPNCSQFPINFPKTSPRGLGYNAPKAGK
jgi:hypothetical protein